MLTGMLGVGKLLGRGFDLWNVNPASRSFWPCSATGWRAARQRPRWRDMLTCRSVQLSSDRRIGSCLAHFSGCWPWASGPIDVATGTSGSSLGIAALVARFWTCHRMYDDLLILSPMVARSCIARLRPAPDGGDVVAGVLLTFTTFAMLAPARLHWSPAPWNLLFTGLHAMIWIAVLFFLLDRARREKGMEIAR